MKNLKVLPHPNLPPEGEGVKDSLSPWERGRVRALGIRARALSFSRVSIPPVYENSGNGGTYGLVWRVDKPAAKINRCPEIEDSKWQKARIKKIKNKQTKNRRQI
ncbi:MAG: hypothetical protein HOL05_13885 [Nitrospinaceae bacterium]|nr:hypothetical protein [Nitrospinaceae bacterium]